MGCMWTLSRRIKGIAERLFNGDALRGMLEEEDHCAADTVFPLVAPSIVKSIGVEAKSDLI